MRMDTFLPVAENATSSQIRHNNYKWRMSYTINIELRKPPRADGSCALYLRILLPQKQSVRFPIGISVAPKDYDIVAKRVKKSHPDYQDYNAIIQNYLTAANDIYKRYRLKNQSITPELLKREFTLNRYSFENFLKYYHDNMHADKASGIISPATFTSEQTTYRKLVRYNDGKELLLFDSVNQEYLRQFNAWMVRQKNAQNTRWNNLKHIKKYMLRAFDAGIIHDKSYKNFKVAAQQGSITALMPSELSLLLKLFHANTIKLTFHQYESLRIFLFMCHTSVSIADVKALTWDNINNGFIQYIRTKNLRREMKKNKIVRVPIVQQALDLIPNKTGKLFNFPYSHDQSFNKAIKISGRICGIKTNLSSHVARHTFATIYMENEGYIDVLQDYLGHSSMDDTMRYNHIRNSRLIKESAKIGLMG